MDMIDTNSSIYTSCKISETHINKMEIDRGFKNIILSLQIYCYV